LQPLNIIFIMTDQHRCDHVGFYGDTFIETPHLDRLAESAAFSNCLSVNPICAPARSSLLTGKYSHQIGTLGMSGDLHPQHPTYPQALQRAGYYTAGIGKFHWHQGWEWSTPKGKGHDLVAMKHETLACGFDHVWEVSGKQLVTRNYCEYAKLLDQAGVLDAYRDWSNEYGRNHVDVAHQTFEPVAFPFEEKLYVDIAIGDQAIQSLELRPKDQPFYMFVSFCGPHPPYDAPQKYLDLYQDDESPIIPDDRGPISEQSQARIHRLRRSYKAMIHVIDEQVGRILDTLEAQNILDSTVILFTADHGEMMGDHGRVQKGSFYKSSVNVPAAIAHPHYSGRKQIDKPVELTDFTATILDVAGIHPQEALSLKWPHFNNIVPSRSLLPLLSGKADSIRPYAFSECAHRGVWNVIQNERWKYVKYLIPHPDEGGVTFLFDLINDPLELKNLASDPTHSVVLQQLEQARRDVLDSTPAAQTRWVRTL
jgi:arylsulfatase